MTTNAEKEEMEKTKESQMKRGFYVLDDADHNQPKLEELEGYVEGFRNDAEWLLKWNTTERMIEQRLLDGDALLVNLLYHILDFCAKLVISNCHWSYPYDHLTPSGNNIILKLTEGILRSYQEGQEDPNGLGLLLKIKEVFNGGLEQLDRWYTAISRKLPSIPGVQHHQRQTQAYLTLASEIRYRHTTLRYMVPTIRHICESGNVGNVSRYTLSLINNTMSVKPLDYTLITQNENLANQLVGLEPDPSPGFVAIPCTMSSEYGLAVEKATLKPDPGSPPVLNNIPITLPRDCLISPAETTIERPTQLVLNADASAFCPGVTTDTLAAAVSEHFDPIVSMDIGAELEVTNTSGTPLCRVGPAQSLQNPIEANLLRAFRRRATRQQGLTFPPNCHSSMPDGLMLTRQEEVPQFQTEKAAGPLMRMMEAASDITKQETLRNLKGPEALRTYLAFQRLNEDEHNDIVYSQFDLNGMPLCRHVIFADGNVFEEESCDFTNTIHPDDMAKVSRGHNAAILPLSKKEVYQRLADTSVLDLGYTVPERFNPSPPPLVPVKAEPPGISFSYPYVPLSTQEFCRRHGLKPTSDLTGTFGDFKPRVKGPSQCAIPCKPKPRATKSAAKPSGNEARALAHAARAHAACEASKVSGNLEPISAPAGSPTETLVAALSIGYVGDRNMGGRGKKSKKGWLIKNAK